MVQKQHFPAAWCVFRLGFLISIVFCAVCIDPGGGLLGPEVKVGDFMVGL